RRAARLPLPDRGADGGGMDAGLSGRDHRAQEAGPLPRRHRRPCPPDHLGVGRPLAPAPHRSLPRPTHFRSRGVINMPDDGSNRDAALFSAVQACEADMIAAALAEGANPNCYTVSVNPVYDWENTKSLLEY